MNLFFKSYKFSLFFFLICASKGLILQGIEPSAKIKLFPEIVQYHVPDIYNLSNNTSLCRNNEGVFFIGKEDGVLVIDNNDYYYKYFGKKVFLTKTANDKITFLTNGNFGSIELNKINGLIFRSYTDSVPLRYKSFIGEGILSLGNTSFMSTSEGIFVLNGKSAKHFIFQGKKCVLFRTKDHIYVDVSGLGLYLWDSSEFKLFLPFKDYSHIHVSSVSDRNESLYLLANNGLVYQVNKDDKSLFLLPNQPGLENNPKLLYLFSQYYLYFGGETSVWITDLSDSILFPVNRYDQLPVNDMLSTFVDNYNDIWLVYPREIFKFEYPSRSRILDLSALIDKEINKSVYFDGKIYLATDKALIEVTIDDYMNANSRIISDNSMGRFISLASAKGLLLAGSENAVYLPGPDGLNAVFNEGADFIHIIDSASFIIHNENGYSRFTSSSGQWNNELIASEVSPPVSDNYYQDKYWFCTSEKKLFVLTNNDLLSYSLEYLELNGLPELCVHDGKLFILDRKKSYVWNDKQKRFQSTTNSDIVKHIQKSELCVQIADEIWTITRETNDQQQIWRTISENINSPYYTVPSELHLGSISEIYETKEYIWLTAIKKILILNKEFGDIDKNLLRIKTVLQQTEKGVVNHIVNAQKLPFKKSKFVFTLGHTRFQKEGNLKYRYKLTHYQEDWTPWTNSNIFSISNLHERSYTFEAQSLSSFSIKSDPVTFSFKISPPAYRTWYAFMLYIISALIIAFLIYKWRLLNLQKAEIKIEERIKEKMANVLSEKEKSDKLVEDLLPKITAEELKNSGRAKSKKFEMATVLFSDIQGFTKIAEEMNPEVLIDELDKFFFHFDSVVEKYNIEKIKTIGDAYMAAGGIPVKNSSNPVEVVLAGLEMQYYMKDLKRKKTEIWDLRIGIHTGPVISGVVGHKKLSYDIWGDTVNTASRMESSGEAGRVNISGITYGYVKDYFLCEYRGKLPVKYKGNIDMYFVNGLRPELSVDLHGIPNRRFFIKLQLLKLLDVELRLKERYQIANAESLHFHKTGYIQKVHNQAELLGRSENLSDEDQLLVQTASIMLFSGLSETYDNFENVSVEITRTLLPEFGYDENQINRIANLILAAKEIFHPQNILEKILIDSRMEYIGRTDYSTQVKLLYLEIKSHTKEIKQDKFIRKQIEILEKFEFYTVAAKRLREVDAASQIDNLKSWK